jgi:hypothetical protein
LAAFFAGFFLAFAAFFFGLDLAFFFAIFFLRQFLPELFRNKAIGMGGLQQVIPRINV